MKRSKKPVEKMGWNKKTIFNQRLITQALIDEIWLSSYNQEAPFLDRIVYEKIDLGRCVFYLVDIVNLEAGYFRFFVIDGDKPEEADFMEISIKALATEVLPLSVYNERGVYIGRTPSMAYRNNHFKRAFYRDIPELVKYYEKHILNANGKEKAQ